MSRRKPQSPQEKALLDKARRYMPGATLGNAPSDYDDGFIVQGGRGSRVWDFSGNEYIDYLLGSGPMLLGHAHPAVVEAVRQQLDQGSTFFLTNGAIIQLAEEICRAVPCAEMVRFTTSGTDATFQAMRLARAYRRRDLILKFEGGFHGSSDYALQSVTPTRLVDFPTPVPGSAGIPRAIGDTMLIAPFNDLDTTTAIIQAHHEKLAGVIVEPMQRILPPVPGFLEGLREVTARYGVPLIFDEVVTGFRFAYGGAQEYYGVTPDLAALGKVVGGGYPLAAVCGRAEIMRAYDASAVAGDEFIPQIGTLNGNPVAAVTGLATLAELRKAGAYQRLHATGHRLRAALLRALEQAEIPAVVSGEDTVFDVYFTDKPITTYRSTLAADGAMLKRFNRLLLDRGILKGGQKFYVSLAHTDSDLDQTIAAIKDAVGHLRG
ncbi:MAG: aminotransferase class III-fold pyridoxal phosphate-dependent enzyme [Chloroflexi bacterium]|nr:aminotransferase class III-fold pyridoxal phosphate-dependent enzyme [Chloroflexota bacterium]